MDDKLKCDHIFHTSPLIQSFNVLFVKYLSRYRGGLSTHINGPQRIHLIGFTDPLVPNEVDIRTLLVVGEIS